MVQGKVEICGVNTAKLPLLKAADKEALFAKIREGDTAARETYIEGNLRLVLSVIKRFSGSAETAREYVKMGFYISFAGAQTIKKAPHLWDAARAAPLERLLVETDSPYLSPEPLRGRRNEPANVVWVLKKLAALREIPEDEMARITFENARRFYRLPD